MSCWEELRDRQTAVWFHGSSTLPFMTSKRIVNGLLPFQNTILQEISDPASSELTIISRGLGLRSHQRRSSTARFVATVFR